MTTAWTWYVIGLVVFNILGCVALLWYTSRPLKDGSRPEDTSHVWDGDITEYNKPLPRWWINLFYLTILYSIGYLTWFGGWGGLEGYGKWSSAGELKQDQMAEGAKLELAFAPYAGKSIDVIARDPKAVQLGAAIFANTCATCHGSSAQGAIGFPNLRDNAWNWGGTPDDILTTVLDGREGVMPPWGPVLQGMGGDNAVSSMVAYVHSLSDPSRAGDYFALQGGRMYENLCVACHGPEGKGNPALGAPDLTDDAWLYGDSDAQLAATIADGRHGVMPAHRALLGETRARLVAAYVWSLSHAETAAAAAAPSGAGAGAAP